MHIHCIPNKHISISDRSITHPVAIDVGFGFRMIKRGSMGLLAFVEVFTVLALKFPFDK